MAEDDVLTFSLEVALDPPPLVLPPPPLELPMKVEGGDSTVILDNSSESLMKVASWANTVLLA